MLVVAVLTVARPVVDAFRAYEARALAIARGHGARLERCVVDERDPLHLREIHLLRFPDAAALERYRTCPELLALDRPLGIVDTTVYMGADGPRYDG